MDEADDRRLAGALGLSAAASSPPGRDGPPAPRRPDGSGSNAGVMLALTVLGVPVLGVVLLFLPLFLVIVEDAAFGTSRVRDVCDQIGIAEPLGAIYEPVLEPFEPLLEAILD